MASDAPQKPAAKKPAVKKPAAKKAAAKQAEVKTASDVVDQGESVLTAAQLSSASASPTSPILRLTPFGELQPWHRTARHELGVTEMRGQPHNDRILQYHASTTLRATTDEVPWCSSFLCWVMEQTGILSTRSAAASSWLQWGIPLAEPQVGCLVILKRPGGHHVGVYEGRQQDGRLALLGGNQRDKVSIAGFNERDVLGYRWPDVYAKPKR